MKRTLQNQARQKRIKETYYTLFLTDENNEDYKNITGDGIDEVLKSYTMEKNHLEENNTYNRRLLKVVKIIHLLNRFRKHNKEYRKLIDKPEKTTFELQCLADLGKEMKREWELCLQYKAFDVVRIATESAH